MSAVSEPHPSGPTPQALPTDGTPHQPLPSPSPLDPERQMPGTPTTSQHLIGPPGPTSTFTRIADVLLLPVNMWAPLPDYDLAGRLSSHSDERVHNGLYKVLIGAQKLRTQQWRYGYWTMAVSTIYCCHLGWLIGFCVCIHKGLSHLHIRHGTHWPGNCHCNIQGPVCRTQSPVCNIDWLRCHFVFNQRFAVYTSTLLTSSCPPFIATGSGLPGDAFLLVNKANAIIVRYPSNSTVVFPLTASPNFPAGWNRRLHIWRQPRNQTNRRDQNCLEGCSG
jgi:hypothetical protein